MHEYKYMSPYVRCTVSFNLWGIGISKKYCKFEVPYFNDTIMGRYCSTVLLPMKIL